MQTTIKWNQVVRYNPNRVGVYLCLFADGKIRPQRFSRTKDGTCWWSGSNSKSAILYFALPEDITTTDTQKEGEE